MPIPSIETARRIAYRASFAGKLPWEVKGLGGGTEENLPSIGFVGGAQEFLPELDRPALIGESTECLSAALTNRQGCETTLRSW